VTGPIRVLIVDDQPVIRAALAALLRDDPTLEVVGEAGDGAAAVAEAVRLRPAVVLMDVRMPVMDGLAATRAIRAADPAPEVVVLTTFDEDDYALEAVQAGAAGFLLKDGAAEELIRGIRLAAAGDSLIAPATLRRLMRRVAASPQPDLSAAGRIGALTAREREVLTEAAAGASNSEIATALFISEGTVKTHISAILAKLGVRDRVQAVVLAYQGGLVSPNG
jgi:DNA-binding NarL/FixJ family response regulator